MSVLECEILFFGAINIYCQYLQATVSFLEGDCKARRDGKRDSKSQMKR
jgi:hypothetical protein